MCNFVLDFQVAASQKPSLEVSVFFSTTAARAQLAALIVYLPKHVRT